MNKTKVAKLKAMVAWRAWYYVAGWAVAEAWDSYRKLWRR